MFCFLEWINGFVWGIAALILILGVGLYLTVKTGFAQISMFPRAIKAFTGKFSGRNTNDPSSGRAMWTALAATVGTGNLAGVAGAIALGGPGAIFWMWICAILGMITKFAEATLAVHYRQKNQEGEYVGGPMYMIEKGMGNRWKCLAVTYCSFGVIAAFGVGNATQINTVIYSVNTMADSFGVQVGKVGNVIMGVCMAVLITTMLLGGAKRIGEAAEKLVPFASLLYLFLGMGVLLVCRNNLPAALKMIFVGAFCPEAVTGGVLGSVFMALRVGASRGVFTNEAGMGTASIAHGAALVNHPVQQGFMGIVEVFLDTIVICTMTALVILCSGVTIQYGVDTGIGLTIAAFENIYGSWVSIPITIALCLFAFATVLGWSLYGARCAQYIFGDTSWKIFALLQGVTVIISAFMQTGTVWMLSEIMNGLMAIPNLIALAVLSPRLVGLVNEYKKAAVY